MTTTCPSNPPAPAGFKVWTAAVPSALEQWAISLLKGINAVPYGTTWTNGAALARKDYHTWTHRGGQLVTGICIPGITLYSSLPEGYAAASPGNVDPLATPSQADAPALFDAVSTGQQAGTVSPWAIVGIAVAAGGVGLTAWLLTRTRENPLQRGRSRATFEKNLRELLAAGYPRKQALAIAYREQRGS